MDSEVQEEDQLQLKPGGAVPEPISYLGPDHPSWVREMEEDPILREDSIRGFAKAEILKTIKGMVSTFWLLPQCGTTVEALSLLTFGTQSNWSSVDLLRVLSRGGLQTHFFGHAGYWWRVAFETVVEAIVFYQKGHFNKVCRKLYLIDDTIFEPKDCRLLPIPMDGMSLRTEPRIWEYTSLGTDPRTWEYMKFWENIK